jgi:TonB family protein
MRLTRIVLVGLLLLSFTPVWAQQTDSKPDHRLWLDLGVITGDVYFNECLGVWFHIPGGWEINSAGRVSPERAIQRANGALGLLWIFQRTTPPYGNWIDLNAIPASDGISTKDFVTNQVQSKVARYSRTMVLLRDTIGVDYAGKNFFRSDYQETPSDSHVQYHAVVYTRFRGYFIGETVTAESPEETDEAVASLENISFEQDVPDPNCAMGPKIDPPRPSGVISGIITSTPRVPLPAPGQLVRLSPKVSQGMLIKKVQPEYPKAARKNHIQGSVVLQAEINPTGDIENLRLVSGDSALAPAAIDAVKQWKYGPYMLQGQPIRVETQITVQFALQ